MTAAGAPVAVSPCMLELASLTLACPDCPASRAARDLFVSDGLLTNAWYAVLPFLVTGLVVRAVVRRVDRDQASPPRRQP